MIPAPVHADEGALTVAMAVAPGVYSRNRMFAFYKEPAVRRAKARAGMIRGAVRQLAGAHGAVSHLSMTRAAGRCAVRYRVESLHLERRLDLSEAEAACFAYLAARAGVPLVHASEVDRATIDAALRRLAVGLDLRAVDAVNGASAE